MKVAALLLLHCNPKLILQVEIDFERRVIVRYLMRYVKEFQIMKTIEWSPSKVCYVIEKKIQSFQHMKSIKYFQF
jgi:hypothetical protein